MFTYHTSSTCSALITFDIDHEGRLHDVVFYGGCNGNLQGIGRLVEGMDAREAVGKLEGISCNGGPTSCPDQLAKAIKQALNGRFS